MIVNALHLVGRDGVGGRLDLLQPGKGVVVGDENRVVVHEVAHVELVALLCLVLRCHHAVHLADELHAATELDCVVLGLDLGVQQRKGVAHVVLGAEVVREVLVLGHAADVGRLGCEHLARGQREASPHLAVNVNELAAGGLEREQAVRLAVIRVGLDDVGRAIDLVDGRDAVQEAAPRHVLVGPRLERPHQPRPRVPSDRRGQLGA